MARSNPTTPWFVRIKFKGGLERQLNAVVSVDISLYWIDKALMIRCLSWKMFEFFCEIRLFQELSHSTEINYNNIFKKIKFFITFFCIKKLNWKTSILNWFSEYQKIFKNHYLLTFFDSMICSLFKFLHIYWIILFK